MINHSNFIRYVADKALKNSDLRALFYGSVTKKTGKKDEFPKAHPLACLGPRVASFFRQPPGVVVSR